MDLNFNRFNVHKAIFNSQFLPRSACAISLQSVSQEYYIRSSLNDSGRTKLRHTRHESREFLRYGFYNMGQDPL